MSINRKRFFGFAPPFQLLAGHLAKDEDFLADARRILKLDEDRYARLATQLARTDVFMDRSALASLTSEILGGGEEERQVASIIYRIGGMLHDADMPVMEAMDELGKAIIQNADGLDPQEREILIDRLRALAAEPAGLAKQYKARQLVTATGSELDDLQLIYDIRPVFDQERERIEGAIPLAVLRLEYSAPDGEVRVVEMRITEKQIEELENKMATGKRKLNLIKELLASHHLPIPKTKSTVAEED